MWVCKFNADWIQEFSWLGPVNGDKHRGWCSKCMSSLSVKKGRSDLRKHGLTPLHIKNEKSVTAPNPITGGSSKQGSIVEVLQKAHSLQTKQREAKDVALRFKYGLTVAIANHNLPKSFMDCMTMLLKKTITDSEAVKQIQMKRTKF